MIEFSIQLNSHLRLKSMNQQRLKIIKYWIIMSLQDLPIQQEKVLV